MVRARPAQAGRARVSAKPGMARRIAIDGQDYDADAMTPGARALLQQLVFVQDRLQELANQQALLIRARNGYVLDLRTEIEGAMARKIDASALLVTE